MPLFQMIVSQSVKNLTVNKLVKLLIIDISKTGTIKLIII